MNLQRANGLEEVQPAHFDDAADLTICEEFVDRRPASADPIWSHPPIPLPFPFELQLQQPDSGPESLEASEDWVMIYRYKTQACDGQCSRVRDCWYYHTTFDVRRVPAFNNESGWFNYFSKKCVIADWHTGCGYAHNTFELSFHPLLYRTKMCRGERSAAGCALFGRYCGFAHSQQELRQPNFIYPMQSLSERLTPEQRPSPPPGFRADNLPVDAPISPEGLMCLSRTKGALEARLKQLQVALTSRAAEIRCTGCRQDPRMFLQTACGHGLCFLCSQKSISECPACGIPTRDIIQLKID